MHPSSPRAALVAFAALLAPGCSSVALRPLAARVEDPPKTERDEKDKAAKSAALQRKIAISEQKLAQSRLELETFELNSKSELDNAKSELELAKGKLAQFVEIDAKNRLAQAELELRSAKDSAQEAAEELAQIELMYKDQDLDDKTAEFVLQRGKRNAERAQQRIAIKDRENAGLVQHQLPREKQQMELDVTKKALALEKAQKDAVTGRMGKMIGLASAESELIEQKVELAKLSEPAPAEGAK